MYLNNLQSYIFGGILIFMICLVACEKSETEASLIAFGQSAELKKSDFTYFGDNIKDGLKVSVEEIKDSRCPINVVCVWEGEAIVKLNIVNLNDSITVSLKHASKDSIVNFNLNNAGYQAKLHSVNPYPNTSKPRDISKAVISLIKK